VHICECARGYGASPTILAHTSRISDRIVNDVVRSPASSFVAVSVLLSHSECDAMTLLAIKKVDRPNLGVTLDFATCFTRVSRRPLAAAMIQREEPTSWNSS